MTYFKKFNLKKLSLNLPNNNNSLMQLKKPNKITQVASIALVSSLALVSIFAFVLPGQSQTNPVVSQTLQQNSTKKVKTLKLEKVSSVSSDSINFDGKVTNETEVRISASTPATVKSVNFTRGKYVKKGELLATLGGKTGPHPLQIAVIQAQTNLSNLDTNLNNLNSSNDNSLAKADQQIKSLESSITDLQKTLDLTKDSTKITVSSAEQSLKSLEGDIVRQEDAVKKNSNQINASIDQQKIGAKAFVQQNASGIANSLTSLSSTLPSVYNSQAQSLIQAMNGYKNVDDKNIVNVLGSFDGSLNDINNFLQDIIRDNTSGPAVSQTVSLLSSTIASARAQSVSQRASLDNTGVNREAQTSQGVNALDSLKSKRTDLQLALDKAKNATNIQEQATLSQINNLKQQIESSKLLLDTAKIGAQTQVDSTEGQRKLLELQLQSTISQASGLNITSPIDGVITDLKITPNQEVSAGLELVTVYGTGGKYVRGYAKPKDIEYIKSGQEIDLTLSGDDQPSGKARVSVVYPVADSNTGLIPVDLEIFEQKNELAFVPGAKVEGKFKVQSDTANQTIFIPNNSISIDGQKKFVWVVEDGKATKKYIVLGPNNGENVEATDGLIGNEELILTNLADLSDGLKVSASN